MRISAGLLMESTNLSELVPGPLSRTGNAMDSGRMGAAPMASDASLVMLKPGGRLRLPCMVWKLYASRRLPSFQS